MVKKKEEVRVIKKRGKQKREKPASTKGLVRGQLYIDMRNKPRGVPFPKGNDWWNRRSVHGPKVLFSDPVKLWEAAVEYFTYIRDNPLMEEKHHVGQFGVTVTDVPHMRPYTMDGLTLYLGISDTYIRDAKIRIENSKSLNDKGLSLVISLIEKTIRNQKFEGAASGFLNANIISRDLGLRDATDVTTNGKAFNPQAPVINVYDGAPPIAEKENEIDEPDKPKQLK